MHLVGHDIAGRPVAHGDALIRKLRLFVTNDTWTHHVEAALKVPVTAIFGSTNPVTTGPFGTLHAIVRPPDIPECSPCLKKTCPSGSYQCLTSITPADVFYACRQLIDRGQNTHHD